MGKRHQARRAAVQCLYQWEVTGKSPQEIFAGYWQSQGEATPAIRDFAEYLVDGVLTHATEIDAMIAAQTKHWRLDRLGLVEKSILRLGAYEIFFETSTPSAVAIDEAIELAKRFSGADSGPLVNGVLDAINRHARAGSASEA